MQRQIFFSIVLVLSSVAGAIAQSAAPTPNPLNNFIGGVQSAVGNINSANSAESSTATSSSSSSSSSFTSASSTSTTPAPAPASSSPSSTAAVGHSSGLSEGAKIGIIVGCVVAGVLIGATIVGLCCCLLRRRHRKRRAVNTVGDEEVKSWGKHPIDSGREYSPISGDGRTHGMQQHPAVPLIAAAATPHGTHKRDDSRHHNGMEHAAVPLMAGAAGAEAVHNHKNHNHSNSFGNNGTQGYNGSAPIGPFTHFRNDGRDQHSAVPVMAGAGAVGAAEGIHHHNNQNNAGAFGHHDAPNQIGNHGRDGPSAAPLMAGAGAVGAAEGLRHHHNANNSHDISNQNEPHYNGGNLMRNSPRQHHGNNGHEGAPLMAGAAAAEGIHHHHDRNHNDNFNRHANHNHEGFAAAPLVGGVVAAEGNHNHRNQEPGNLNPAGPPHQGTNPDNAYHNGNLVHTGPLSQHGHHGPEEHAAAPFTGSTAAAEGLHYYRGEHSQAPSLSQHPALRQSENPFVPVPPTPRRTAPNSREGLTDGMIPGAPAYIASERQRRKGNSRSRSRSNPRPISSGPSGLRTHNDADRPPTPFGLSGIGQPYEDMHVHVLQTDAPSRELQHSLRNHERPINQDPLDHYTKQRNSRGFSTPPEVPSRSPNRENRASMLAGSSYESSLSTTTPSNSSGEHYQRTPELFQPAHRAPVAPWEAHQNRFSNSPTTAITPAAPPIPWDEQHSRRQSHSPRQSRSSNQYTGPDGRRSSRSPATSINGQPRRLRFEDLQSGTGSGVGSYGQHDSYDNARWGHGVGEAL